MQALPNGNWFAGWGSVGEYTEFTPDGTVVLDANIQAAMASYRAFKFAWTGTPTNPPSVAAERDGSSLRIAASWNGATKVTRWQVLTGPDTRSLQPEGTFAKNGFETAMHVPAADAAVVEVRRARRHRADARDVGTRRCALTRGRRHRAVDQRCADRERARLTRSCRVLRRRSSPDLLARRPTRRAGRVPGEGSGLRRGARRGASRRDLCSLRAPVRTRLRGARCARAGLRTGRWRRARVRGRWRWSTNALGGEARTRES